MKPMTEVRARVPRVVATRVDSSPIWIDTTNPPASVKKDTSWLVFRGAFLFEQYHEPGKQRGAPPVLDVQWPLVTQCQYKSNTTVYSALGICSTDHPLFYFSFHLPFPVRRTSRDDDKSRAFPFSAIYGLAPVQDDHLLEFDTLVAGWRKDDALPNQTQPTDTSFPFQGRQHYFPLLTLPPHRPRQPTPL